ncbi:hypothetical protein IM792_12390 [Mucilaginibacter sp. JRF]|uniref:DUF6263 family protein n=1 Tax=Mucilaginibacter sp. JRF TaxID=2780088 RepID=UPI00187E7A7F|nr:DUF6263 family protein [Mucilaginibacter sp. JRF]MBE9585251.1 hypothetical protein [Mucilaginibacter sp. JRF]
MKKLLGTVLLLLCTVAAIGQKLKPALNLAKDGTYSLLIKQTTTTTQTIRQRPLETTLILAAKVSFTVTDVKDTLYTISAKYDSVNLQMDLPNGTLQFSSERVDSANLYSKALAQLKGKSFQFTQSRSGRVIAIDQADENLANVTNNLKADTAQREQTFKQLQASLGDDAFRAIIEKVFLIYPSSAINKTEKWTIGSQIPGEPALALRNFYFIKSVLTADITIQGNGTAVSIARADTAKLNGMPVERSMAGNINSVITINKKTGLPKTAEITQNLKGNIIIADNIKLPGGLVIPIVTNSNLKVNTP